MRCTSKSLNLYIVTDRRWAKQRKTTLDKQVEDAIKAGATFVQLREKMFSEEEFIREARKIQKVCNKYKIPFVINDNANIAKAINADGIHVGQNDMRADRVRDILGEEVIVGVSVQNVEQALIAQEYGADYLGVGAIFTTNSKSDAEDVSIDTLRSITKAVSIPVIAIGGINEDNITKLYDSGICGVAVISAIFAKKNIGNATRQLKNKTIKLVEENNYEREPNINNENSFSNSRK